MPVFRVSKERDYTVLSNRIFRDRSLSAKAKGILVEMLSLPEEWDYTLKGLSTLFTDGLDSIRKGIQELEEHGYVVRQRRRDAKGRLGGTEYVIYETPHEAETVENPVENLMESEENLLEPVENFPTDAPECPFPATAWPALENPTQDCPAQENATAYKVINQSSKKESNTNIIHPSIEESESFSPMDRMGYDAAREVVKANIEYDVLLDRFPSERLDEIVDLAAEALCSYRKFFTLGADTYPYELVEQRLLQLNASHVEYVISCLDGNTTDIRNIKPYLLKTLVNAPATMSSYYTAKVNHDLYGERRRE